MDIKKFITEQQAICRTEAFKIQLALEKSKNSMIETKKLRDESKILEGKLEILLLLNREWNLEQYKNYNK